MRTDIQPGDVVRLKSGGFPMTVTVLQGQFAYVAWTTSDGALKTASIQTTALMLEPGPA